MNSIVRTLPIRGSLVAIASAAVCFVACLPAHAQTARTWVGSTADMSTADNWSPSGVPSASLGDSLIFDGSSSQNALIFPGGTFSANNGLGDITIAAGQTDALSIVNSGTANSVFRLRAGADVTIASGGGAFTLGGSGNAFYLNLAASSSGNHFVNDSTSLATIASPVSINASGGSGGHPIFEGSGDWLVSATITNAITYGLVKNGAGTLTLNGSNAYTGGTTVTGGTLKLGNAAALGATGSNISVSNGATLDLNGVVNADRDYNATISGAGIGGNGAIVNNVADQNHGFKTVTLAGDATIGGTKRWDIRPVTAGQAVLDLAGFTLTKTGSNYIALVDGTLSSDGTINVTQGILGLTRFNVSGNGAINVASGARLRLEGNATGSLSKAITLTTATLDCTSSDATITSTIGLTGNNTIDTQTGRTLSVSGQISGSGQFTKIGGGTLVLSGANSYSGGTILSSGSGVLRVTNTGGFGSGAITINGGTLELLNDGAGSNGTITYGTNSKLTNSGNTATIHVGNNGANTGNTIVLPGAYNLGNSTLNVTGANDYNLGIPALSTGGGSVGTAIVKPTTANLILGTVSNGSTAHTLRLDGTSTGNMITGTISNGSGALAIMKASTGTWALSGANTYTGTTTVTNGTLLVNNTSGSGTGAGPVVVNGGRLGGSGSIAGAVTVNDTATLAPGNSPGVLTLGDGVTFNLGSTFEAELNGPTVGAEYDQLRVTAGLVDLGDEQATLSILLGYDPDVNTSFTIIDNQGPDAVDGIFAGLGEGTHFDVTFSGLAQPFVITYFGGDGNDVVLTAVPEPSTLALLIGLAGIGLLGCLRRRRKC